ncbi:TolC family protein [Rickettsiales endosymbiont of Trichoplax sp. H2]|uniref:TolC family protein n=1 Tax=Rickettsiales endosymbiont of Trichoplax sp. H2 TaxID=2021221 RepID=UPI0012B2F6E6|nr:TolC family protein [Rickettsiales endosymbiont of Trichoplax sp. H2]MSO13843.1 Outer membrane efflux protein BepC [Rickettsiales endosymbiont of Trichoplax sp. H2]
MNFGNLLKIIILIIIFSVNINFAKAYNLNDAINSTLINNDQIQAAKKKLEIAILAKPKAMTEFLPDVNAKLNKTFLNPDGLSSSSNSSNFTFAIEQDIFTGGSTVAKLAAADAEINAAYQEYNKSLNEIILNAITSYQNVLTFRELVKVQRENVDMAQKHVEKATITVKTGAETKTSLFMAKASLAAMKSSLEDYLVQQNQAESSYLYLIGEEAPKNIDIIDVKRYPKIDSVDKLKIMVNAQNPDLLTLKNKLKASKQGINIQASTLLPKVSLFANRSINKYSNNFPGNKVGNGNNYGIQMSIPLLYKGGIQYLNISEAKKRNKQTEYSLKDIIKQVDSKTSDAWKTYISSENIYKSYLSSEDNYYKTYLSTQSEFDVGAKTLMDVINRQKDYNTAIINRLQKEKDYKLSSFKIYDLIGNLPKVLNENSLFNKKKKDANK